MAATCNNAVISISFTNGIGDYFAVQFDKFGAPPRSYVEQTDLTFSVAGSAVQTGSSRKNRMQWSIATWGTREDAFTVDEMFRSWDTDRATGRASVLLVQDQTFVRDTSNPIVASAVFTSAPTFESRAGDLWLISFGLTEI